jgi:myo-inositol-1(or 4)-monophosphatase
MSPSNPAADQLLDLAVELAVGAGEVITDMREEAVASPDTKSSPTDPVTAADRRAEEIVVEGILARRPDDGIIGEEGTDRTGTSGVDWYIDPIDGTTNYLYGVPAYSVSVAAAIEGTVVAGAVYNPEIDELFTASRGGGAKLNGESITVAEPVDLASSLIATGFGYRPERRRRQAEIVASLLPEVRDIRRFGSAALDLCWVACGRVDGYFEAGLNSWDYSAGALVATEAGARCHDLRSAAPSSVFLVAAAPAIDDDLTATLRSLEADDLPG